MKMISVSGLNRVLKLCNIKKRAKLAGSLYEVTCSHIEAWRQLRRANRTIKTLRAKGQVIQ